MEIPERQLEGVSVMGTPRPDHLEHVTFCVGVVGNRPEIGPPKQKTSHNSPAQSVSS